MVLHRRHRTPPSPTRAAAHERCRRLRRRGPPQMNAAAAAVPLKDQTDRRPTKMIKPYFCYKPYLFTRFSFARLCCSPTNGMSAMKKNRRPPHWDLFRSVSDQFFSCQNSSGNWLPSSRNTQPTAACSSSSSSSSSGSSSSSSSGSSTTTGKERSSSAIGESVKGAD
jgi:hypothetical protein